MAGHRYLVICVILCGTTAVFCKPQMNPQNDREGSGNSSANAQNIQRIAHLADQSHDEPSGSGITENANSTNESSWESYESEADDATGEVDGELDSHARKVKWSEARSRLLMEQLLKITDPSSLRIPHIIKLILSKRDRKNVELLQLIVEEVHRYRCRLIKSKGMSLHGRRMSVRSYAANLLQGLLLGDDDTIERMIRELRCIESSDSDERCESNKKRRKRT